jgi:hypothetical protein
MSVNSNNVDYKITQFNETTGSIVISFNNDNNTLNVDIPLDENNHYITGAALDSYIRGFIPVTVLDRISTISSGIPNKDDIHALVEKPTEQEVEINQNAIMWEEYNFSKKVGDILVKFGVLTTNPTELPVTTL